MVRKLIQLIVLFFLVSCGSRGQFQVDQSEKLRQIFQTQEECPDEENEEDASHKSHP